MFTREYEYSFAIKLLSVERKSAIIEQTTLNGPKKTVSGSLVPRERERGSARDVKSIDRIPGSFRMTVCWMDDITAGMDRQKGDALD